MINKVPKESVDITEANIEKLKKLFPEILTDGEKIDFNKLKLILGDEVDDEKERYSFTWPGKRDAILGAQQPSKGTLRPNIEKSKNFDSTENLYIEGDNLEVLKLLQKSYNNKIKVIYIDPPYNTGKDFVYKDNYKSSIDNYLEQSGQVDSEGNMVSTNSESNGRFHTDWLNMMYPRLKLARNLLTDDGVIFISIDDGELANLKKICDEIFGKQNMVADFVWQKKKGGGNDSVHVATEHEYILLYAKNKTKLSPFFGEYDESYLKRYKEEDEIGRFYWDTFKRKSGKQYYPITAPDGIVLQYDEKGNEISWLRSEPRFKEDLEEGEIKFVKGMGGWSVHFKQRLPKGKKPRSIIMDKGTTSNGSEELLEIFNRDVFSNPKPTTLIKYLISMIDKKDSIILDFFAGSSTTADATMALNAADGGKRKYITIQLPEKLDNTSADANKEFNSISDIGSERIRRAGEMIVGVKPELKDTLDIGIKYLKLDKSNIKEWSTDFDNIETDLFEEIFIEGRTELDIVYEIMLKNGLELTLPMDTFKVNEKTIYDIAFGSQFICLANDIDMNVAQAIIRKRDEHGKGIVSGVVFKDSGFNGNDSNKLNSIQLLIDAGFTEESIQTI